MKIKTLTDAENLIDRANDEQNWDKAQALYHRAAGILDGMDVTTLSEAELLQMENLQEQVTINQLKG